MPSPPPSPLHSEITLRLTLEVTDPKRLHEYLVEALGPERASRADPLFAYLHNEVGRVAHQVPGVKVRRFRGGATGP